MWKTIKKNKGLCLQEAWYDHCKSIFATLGPIVWKWVRLEFSNFCSQDKCVLWPSVQWPITNIICENILEYKTYLSPFKYGWGWEMVFIVTFSNFQPYRDYHTFMGNWSVIKNWRVIPPVMGMCLETPTRYQGSNSRQWCYACGLMLRTFTTLPPMTPSLIWVKVMVFNATFNNISAISWRSVLLVEEAGVPRENNPTCRKSLTNFIT